jgi:uncharacterized membrane protein YccC
MQKAAQEVRIRLELWPASKRLVSWPTLLRKLRIFNEAGTHYALGIEKFEAMEREKSLRDTLGREPTDAELRDRAERLIRAIRAGASIPTCIPSASTTSLPAATSCSAVSPRSENRCLRRHYEEIA